MTPKELVAAVSALTGLPIETVTVIDRHLAEAGLRTRALRGRGNTEMTTMDAANLIIAATVQGPVNGAPSVVLRHAGDAIRIAAILDSGADDVVSIIHRRSAHCEVTYRVRPGAIYGGTR